MDNYYRQTLALSRQYAQQVEQMQQMQQMQQQRSEDARINAERDRLRQEHIERTRMYEAQLFNTVAYSVGSGGGSVSDPSANEFMAEDYIDDYFE